MLKKANKRHRRSGDVVLGEDWVSPPNPSDPDFDAPPRRRRYILINRSPLARKIITFNLVGLAVLVVGVLYLNPFRDSLLLQRERGLVIEAELIANVFEARLPVAADTAPPDTGASEPASAIPDVALRDQAMLILSNLRLPSGIEVFVFDGQAQLIAQGEGARPLTPTSSRDPVAEGNSTAITDALNAVWDAFSSVFGAGANQAISSETETVARTLFGIAMKGDTEVLNGRDQNGNTMFTVATPILQNGSSVGVVAIASATGELDRLVRLEREQLLQMFVVAMLVSIGLSLVLASTIANPLGELATAAELGREKNASNMRPGRIRIPDLTGRPDEIGRLSGALRGMVAALYDRIEANEQFAADVAHEIKNPLASLRSATGTLRVAKREDQRDQLLDVIDHDVRRLDRLVSDISNASRLDSELVKEEEEPFDLIRMLLNLTDYLGADVQEKGIDFITDLPDGQIIIRGLEARLAQVFVNLITNAQSFCDEGDAIRVWARRRNDRVLVVVEDTGPGIPNEALSKVFERFYSERPEHQFGNNSGLGLAISKQIVEAHGGVIWAENIRPTEVDIMSAPLGARFVVGLPV